jgi:hypothetical protein
MMIPTSISASSLKTAEECLAKYKAYYIDKADGFGNDAATLGTTIHSALEKFLSPTVRTSVGWDFDILLSLFGVFFDKNFNRIERDSDPVYQDGVRILTNWFHRPGQYGDINNVTIISQEVKSEFKVPYILDGIKQFIPFRYIIDRLDQISSDIYRVVDYKSQRSPLKAEELRKSVQARGYGLATQIMYPEAKEIQVQFDFLRYQSVTIFLTRKDNERTWEYLKRQLQAIIDTDADTAPETLGVGCQYCLRKFTCKTAMRNIDAGGILANDLDELADLMQRASAQQKLAGDIQAQAEKAILASLKEDDEQAYYGERYQIERGISSRRELNLTKLSEILGSDLMSQFMNEMGKLTLGDFDVLKKDDRLSDEQKSLLSSAIQTKIGGEKLKISRKKEELQ